MDLVVALKSAVFLLFTRAFTKRAGLYAKDSAAHHNLQGVDAPRSVLSAPN